MNFTFGGKIRHPGMPRTNEGCVARRCSLTVLKCSMNAMCKQFYRCIKTCDSEYKKRIHHLDNQSSSADVERIGNPVTLAFDIGDDWLSHPHCSLMCQLKFEHVPIVRTVSKCVASSGCVSHHDSDICPIPETLLVAFELDELHKSPSFGSASFPSSYALHDLVNDEDDEAPQSRYNFMQFSYSNVELKKYLASRMKTTWRGVRSYLRPEFYKLPRQRSTSTLSSTTEPPQVELPRIEMKPLDPEFLYSLLLGNWRVVRGLGDLFDCYCCQTISFSPHSRSKNGQNLNMNHNMQILEGEKKEVNVNLQITPADTGVLMRGDFFISSGYGGQTTYRVIAVSSDSNYILLYYCQKFLLGSDFQGAVILSRREYTLTNQVEEFFEMALEQSGLPVRMADFCYNNHDEC